MCVCHLVGMCAHLYLSVHWKEDEYHFKIEEEKKEKKISEEPNGGKKYMIQTNNNKTKKYERKNMNWNIHCVEQVFSMIASEKQ